MARLRRSRSLRAWRPGSVQQRLNLLRRVLQPMALQRRRWSWQPPQSQARSHWLQQAQLRVRVQIQL